MQLENAGGTQVGYTRRQLYVAGGLLRKLASPAEERRQVYDAVAAARTCWAPRRRQ